MPRHHDEDERNQYELDLSEKPISWYELAAITQEHEHLWRAWETAKVRTKEAKAAYDESYAHLRGAFGRVRKSAERDAKALANRQGDEA